jgi:large subunit ribosomal protein L24
MQKKLHIKKGDMVKVLAGEERGRQGRVIEVDRKRTIALVEGLNLNKKHSKPTTAVPQGGIRGEGGARSTSATSC